MSVPSEESWSRTHGILFDYSGVDDLACVLAGTFARKTRATSAVIRTPGRAAVAEQWAWPIRPPPRRAHPTSKLPV